METLAKTCIDGQTARILREEDIDVKTLGKILCAHGFSWEFDDKANLWITSSTIPVSVIAAPQAKLIVVSTEFPPWKDVEGRWSIDIEGTVTEVIIQQWRKESLGAAFVIDYRGGFNCDQFITIVRDFLFLICDLIANWELNAASGIETPRR